MAYGLFCLRVTDRWFSGLMVLIIGMLFWAHYFSLLVDWWTEPHASPCGVSLPCSEDELSHGIDHKADRKNV
jgi:hypothetical protein